VAVRDRSQRFALDLWARRRGLEQPEDPKAAAAARYDCDRFSCVPISTAPTRVALWWGRRAPSANRVAGLCARAEVVVLRSGEGADHPACRGRLVLDEHDFAWGRAAEVFRTPDGWRIAWAEPVAGRRPWSHRL
jgi:competence protein ComEC